MCEDLHVRAAVRVEQDSLSAKFWGSGQHASWLTSRVVVPISIVKSDGFSVPLWGILEEADLLDESGVFPNTDAS